MKYHGAVWGKLPDEYPQALAERTYRDLLDLTVEWWEWLTNETNSLWQALADSMNHFENVQARNKKLLRELELPGRSSNNKIF